MANCNNILKITSATVTVEAPMHRPLILFRGRDICHWENIFISLRDNEQNIDYKRNYDRCRALLKYAYSCWGDLMEISNGDGNVIFIFKFDSVSAVKAFEKNFCKDVEGATM